MRFRPIRDCYHNDQYWTPDSDDVLVADEAPKHFVEIGKNKNSSAEETGTDSMTEEERAVEIRKAVASFDENDPEFWTGAGKVKIDAVTQAVKFATTRKEVEAALKNDSIESKSNVLG